MKYLKSFAATMITFLVIDLAWIGLFLGDIYAAQLGSMMRSSPSATAAAVFYVAYIAGIIYLAVRPALATGRVGTAIAHGGALGAIAYGTYTLTNYVIFSKWTVMLVVSDIGWGAFLTAVSAAAGFLAAKN